MRVAVVAGPDPGHAFPAAALATALQRAGHTAVVVTGAAWLPAMRAAGLAARELPLLAPEPADVDAGHRLWVRAARMAEPLREVLGQEGAEAVVADTLTRCGGLAAGLAGLAWAELVPHPLAEASVALPPYGTGWAPWPARDRVLRALARRSLRAGERQRRAALARLAPAAGASPRVRLVATLPALEPPRPDWPQDAVVVGALEWDPARRPLPPPPGDQPLVVVSGSTATGARGDLGEATLAACAGLGVRLAQTCLRPVQRRLPGWAVAGPGRQDLLLAEASAVVCAGGHGMVAKALARGLPLVCVPGGGDQKEVAARVARLGAGLVATPAGIGAALGRVLADPSFARAARAAAARRAGADPVAALVAALG